MDELSEGVIGAAIAVHSTLGPGFLEVAYERALSIELRHRRIPHELQVVVPLTYRGESIGETRLDLVVAKRLVVELKSLERFADVHYSQLLAYLKASGIEIGLLINFNVRLLRNGIRRLVFRAPT